MSVRQCQREVDAAEFAEWLAYFALEPFGYERHETGHAIVAMTVANVFSKKRHKLKEFMPEYGPKKRKQQTLSQMRDLMNTYTKLHNSKFK